MQNRKSRIWPVCYPCQTTGEYQCLQKGTEDWLAIKPVMRFRRIKKADRPCRFYTLQETYHVGGEGLRLFGISGSTRV
jgi:hypothetical protein